MKRLGGPDISAAILVGNASIIDEFRILIKSGKMPHDGCQFKYNHKIVPHDKNGKFLEYPEGFCDYDLNRLRKLTTSVEEW